MNVEECRSMRWILKATSGSFLFLVLLMGGCMAPHEIHDFFTGGVTNFSYRDDFHPAVNLKLNEWSQVPENDLLDIRLYEIDHERKRAYVFFRRSLPNANLNSVYSPKEEGMWVSYMVTEVPYEGLEAVHLTSINGEEVVIRCIVTR